MLLRRVLGSCRSFSRRRQKRRSARSSARRGFQTLRNHRPAPLDERAIAVEIDIVAEAGQLLLTERN